MRTQIGGIETFDVWIMVQEKGLRIAWINTRKLGFAQSGNCAWNGYLDALFSMKNQSGLDLHAGGLATSTFSNQGIDWLRTFFGGGLVTTLRA